MAPHHRLPERTVRMLCLLTVEPYIFFILFGYIVRLVTLQDLLFDRSCRSIHQFSDDICDHLADHKAEGAQVQSTGNNLYMGFMMTNSLPAMIVAIFLGPWSDKYTRKYPMIFASFGMLVEAIISAILTAFPTVSPVWYVVCGLFSGVTGGFIISVSSTFSYLSDVTDEKSRPARFAILEFFNISAIVFGNLIGGQVYKAYGYLHVLSLAPFSFLVAILYAIFVMKETKPPVPPDKKLDMFRDLVRLDNIKMSYETCARTRPGNIKMQIWMLVWISCSVRFTDMGTLAVGFPFAQKSYDWDVEAFSNASIAFYVANAIVTVAFIPFLSNHMRLHEAAIGLVGMLSLISKMVVTSVAIYPALFYFGWMSGTLANGAGIAVRSRLSKLVHKEELGRAFSLLGTLESVTPLLGSVAFLQIYNLSVTSFPGLAFACGAIFLLPSAAIFTWMMGMPTISLSEYARQELESTARPLEDIASDKYARLQEDRD